MRAVVLLLVVGLLAAGCGSDEPAAGAGEAVSVREAIELGTGEPLRVRGYVLERAGVPRLCEAILESYPPQCGEPSLRLEGHVTAGSEELVELLGAVDGGVFRVTHEP